MKRFALILTVAITALFGALGPAGIAGAYPPGKTSGITTNVPTVKPGGTFTATVNNCLPGETVVITVGSASQTVTCDSTTLQASASFAANNTPGTYQVCANFTGTGATVPAGVTRPSTACTTIQVIAAGPTVPATTPGGGLPATGSSGLGTTATSAIVLISAGALLLIVTQVRRRRAAAATVTP